MRLRVSPQSVYPASFAAPSRTTRLSKRSSPDKCRIARGRPTSAGLEALSPPQYRPWNRPETKPKGLRDAEIQFRLDHLQALYNLDKRLGSDALVSFASLCRAQGFSLDAQTFAAHRLGRPLRFEAFLEMLELTMPPQRATEYLEHAWQLLSGLNLPLEPVRELARHLLRKSVDKVRRAGVGGRSLEAALQTFIALHGLCDGQALNADHLEPLLRASQAAVAALCATHAISLKHASLDEMALAARTVLVLQVISRGSVDATLTAVCELYTYAERRDVMVPSSVAEQMPAVLEQISAVLEQALADPHEFFHSQRRYTLCRSAQLLARCEALGKRLAIDPKNDQILQALARKVLVGLVRLAEYSLGQDLLDDGTIALRDARVLATAYGLPFACYRALSAEALILQTARIQRALRRLRCMQAACDTVSSDK